MMQYRPNQPPGRGGGYPPRQPRRLPPDYLKEGYFSKDSVLHDRLIVRDPQDIVTALTDRNLQDKPMDYSQIRRFFAHARQSEHRFRGGQEWDSVRQDVLRLEPYAADAVTRQVAPRVFQDFIRENAKRAAQSPEAFLKGFLIHFECIIAFWPRRGQR